VFVYQAERFIVIRKKLGFLLWLPKEFQMTDKQSQDKQGSPSPATELAQLRQIVFGDAQIALEQKIEQLGKTLQAQLKQHEQHTARQFTQLQTALESHVDQLELKLLNADKGQDAKANELFTLSKNLSSELEMVEATNKQENDELHKRIDQDIATLSNKFSEQLKEALAQLTRVSSELNASKTDRKTLAKLLSTVASNLETGDDE
jgi:enamine deaminase RidA (YjgF/YER057c/UK114 family)